MITVFFCARCILLRHLDSDLGTIMKSAEEFDWNRVNFILEVGAIKIYAQNVQSKLYLQTYVQNLGSKRVC